MWILGANHTTHPPQPSPRLDGGTGGAETGGHRGFNVRGAELPSSLHLIPATPGCFPSPWITRCWTQTRSYKISSPIPRHGLGLTLPGTMQQEPSRTRGGLVVWQMLTATVAARNVLVPWEVTCLLHWLQSAWTTRGGAVKGREPRMSPRTVT